MMSQRPERRLKSGRYNSAREVMREAPRLLDQDEMGRAVQLAEFNSELGRRLDALDRGEHVDAATVRVLIHRRSLERQKGRA
jgi:antitoxin ParD1/3/4